MSNYDVIESYNIDFTTFNNRNDAIINNNKFVFTGNVVVGINYERIQVEKYNSYKILIKGLTGSICYYYGNIDNLIVSPVQEYPDMLKGVTIGNGKIRIGLPGINKDIVLDTNDIETFKQSLVK